MGIRGLDWQTISVPLAAGLQQKADVRAMQPPGLLIAKEVQFDEIGGLQLRHPYADIGTAIYGGGALSGVRKIIADGGELLAFTETKLYSWSSTLSKWVEKGSHLAVKVEETERFTSAGDQFDVDRAELNGTIFYTWADNGAAGYLAAVDKATGTVILAPTYFSAVRRPRLVPLATKVLLVFGDGVAGIYCYSLDPAAPGTAIAGASTTVLNSGIGAAAKYDITPVAGTDTAVIAIAWTVTTSYSVGTITATPTVSLTTKVRTCTGAIAVSVDPTGASVQVVRANALDVQGDLITISGMVDVYTAQAIGTTATNAAELIGACHRSTQDSGVYRCYVYWVEGSTASGGSDWFTQQNWVSTGNTLGTALEFKRRWAPRARPFDRAGTIYVWGAFYGRSEFAPFGTKTALQSSYFLLRDDGFMCAKAVTNAAGAGAGGAASDGQGWLPNCQSIGSNQYAFAATSCRVIATGTDSSNFAARSPRDVVVTFDTNEARRTARLGRTLYIAAGEILQYDGEKLTEVGFHQAPWYVLGAEDVSGSIATNGTYALKNTWRSANARGEIERSTSFAVGAIDVASQPAGITLATGEPLYLTHKSVVAWEAWRTAVNPQFDSPFYLVTGKDPSTVAGSNCFVFNVDDAVGMIPTFTDEFSDATATTKENNPENGGYLENIAPPPASIILASSDRLFLAGVAGDPHRVWYSKLRNDNEIASFNDALTANIPREGGGITGLAFLNETLIVFRETAIYALSGDGFDNLGGGQTYGPARMLSSDVGATAHESIALGPMGLVFKSSKGWYLLNRGWGVEYIGAPVSDYDGDTVIGVHVLESQHQIRCLTSSRMLVFDYLVGQWAEWAIASGLSAAMWGGTYHYTDGTSIWGEASDYTGVNYGLDIETGWLKLADLQGFGRVRWLMILGEYRGTHTLRIRIARDYSLTYFDDKPWTVSPTDIGQPLQVRHGPSIQQCQAIKVRITAVTVTGSEEGGYLYANPTTEALKLTGLGLELGFRRGLFRNLPAAQKQ